MLSIANYEDYKAWVWPLNSCSWQSF